MIKEAKFGRITYHQPGSDFMVFYSENEKFVGNVPFDIQEGEPIIMEGEYKKSGFAKENEFKFTTIKVDIPEDPYALLLYACSLSKGFGDKKIQAIWDAYGKDWAEHPLLEEIKGLSEKARKSWKESLHYLAFKKEDSKVMGYIMDLGFSQGCADKALKMLKGINSDKDPISQLEANPYLMADVAYQSFATVDPTVMKKFKNIPLEKRVEYCGEYVLGKIQSGSSIITMKEFHLALKSNGVFIDIKDLRVLLVEILNEDDVKFRKLAYFKETDQVALFKVAYLELVIFRFINGKEAWKK